MLAGWVGGWGGGWVGGGPHSTHGIPVEHRVVTWAAMSWGCWGMVGI